MIFDEFDASVLDIEGLTDYRPLVLPNWLRLRLDEMFGALEGHPSDGELVGSHIDEGRGWLSGWGTATIGGEQVLICEAVGLDCECFDAAYIAELIHGGLIVVEPSAHFAVGTTLFFTENRHFSKRKVSAFSDETTGCYHHGLVTG
jgi:hypothetical protein